MHRARFSPGQRESVGSPRTTRGVAGHGSARRSGLPAREGRTTDRSGQKISSRTDGGFPLPHRAWPGRVGQVRVTMKGSGLLQVIAIPINRWRRVEVIGLLQDSGGRGGGKGCGVSRSLRSA